jgi:hypothetical protein
VTRRLLVVVAAMAVMLGLVATPALDETAIGGWLGLPWDGSRGLDQPGQQGEPTASSPTTNQRGGNLSHPSPHARPIRVVTAPNSGAPRASQTRPGGRPGRRRETCMRAHGQVAGNLHLAKGGDGQVRQLPAVAGRHRPGHGAGGSLGIDRGRRSCPFVRYPLAYALAVALDREPPALLSQTQSFRGQRCRDAFSDRYAQ